MWAVSRRRGVFAHSICIPPPFALALLVAAGEAAAISQTAAAVTVSTKKTVNVIPILTLLLLDWSSGEGDKLKGDTTALWVAICPPYLTQLTTQVKRGSDVH